MEVRSIFINSFPNNRINDDPDPKKKASENIDPSDLYDLDLTINVRPSRNEMVPSGADTCTGTYGNSCGGTCREC